MRAWEGWCCRAGTKGPGGSPIHKSSPADITLHRRGASKMEGNFSDLKPASQFPQLARPRAVRAPLAAARTEPEERRVRPLRQALRPGTPAHPLRPPRGSSPARRSEAEPRGPGRGWGTHQRRAPAGTQTAPGDLRRSNSEAVPRARRYPAAHSRPAVPRPGRAPPAPVPPRPTHPARPPGFHWLLGLLNRPRRCRLAVRRGASAPPCLKAGELQARGVGAPQVLPRGVWLLPPYLSCPDAFAAPRTPRASRPSQSGSRHGRWAMRSRELAVRGGLAEEIIKSYK